MRYRSDGEEGGFMALLRFIYHIAFDIVGTDIVDLYTLILL